MPRVVVTGGGGMLGSTLVPYLRARGHSVVLFGRKNADVEIDLSESKPLFDALSNYNPDVIMNLAALADVDECEKHPELAYAANALIVKNLVAWIKEAGTSAHLLQISTDQVYSGPGPHSEEDTCPLNYYAFSKLLGEMSAAQVGATILRTSFFGASRCASRRSLSDWVVSALRRGQPANVFSDILFSPLSMLTLARIVGEISNRRIAGTFNLGSKQGFSKADFAFKIAKCLSLSAESLVRTTAQKHERIARRPADMRMQLAKFERCFGLALPTLEDEIQLLRAEYAEPTTT